MKTAGSFNALFKAHVSACGDDSDNTYTVEDDASEVVNSRESVWMQ